MLFLPSEHYFDLCQARFYLTRQTNYIQFVQHSEVFYDQRFSVPRKFLPDYWLQYWATAPKELLTSVTA